MSDSCSVDGGCSTCSFGQRLTALNEDNGETWPVVLVRFRESSRTRFFAPGSVKASVNDWVIVETSKGEEAGKVIATDQQVRAAVFAGPLKPVQRRAEDHEVALVERLEGEAKVAMRAFRDQIKEHKLQMKPIRAEFSFDAKRLTFYYSAENRIDFRTLVKDLAQHFGVRIDLRQVGARDEAKILGGVGKCGRSLCCSSWLQTYPSVTVKQAKEQDLPLNPTKISGVCGRLLCCLSYENDQYVALKRAMPRLGQFITTPQGVGKIIGLQTLKQRVVTYIEGSGVADFALDELGEVIGGRQGGRPGGEQGRPPAPARGEAPARPAPRPQPTAEAAPVPNPAEETTEDADGTPRAKRSRRRGRRGSRRGGGEAEQSAGGEG